MDIIDSKYIINFFERLNSSDIEYALLNNIGNELPDQLINGKDIDIIVNKKHRSSLEMFMNNNNYDMCIPPLGKANGWKFLYGLDEYQFWKLKECPFDLYIDVSYTLKCKSTMPNCWVPLDDFIQRNLWKNKKWDDDKKWWILDENTRFVYLLVRCIFDKKSFSEKYIDEIERCKKDIDLCKVSDMLSRVFFKYTDRLLDLVSKGLYDIIIKDYFRFHMY